MGARFLVFAFAVMFASTTAQAQDWIDFVDHQWGVGINFPQEPTVEDFEYTNFRERMVPARRFTVETETGRYELTAISFTDDPTDSLTAVSQAIKPIRAKGTPTYDDYINLDGVPGWMISLTQADGSLVQACAYFINQRLYIAEGTVPAGNPPPSNFQQSIQMYDASGKRIDFVQR